MPRRAPGRAASVRSRPDARPQPDDDRARTGPKPSLTRDRIAAAALEIADREGLDAVTMRRLGTELGVGTMTLYGYFRDKDELLDAAVDLASSEKVEPAPDQPWKPTIRQLWMEASRVLERHPTGIYLRFRRPLISRGVLRLPDATLRALGEAGFPPAEAAVALRVLFLFTFGYATFNPLDVPEEVRASWQAVIDDLPPGELPSVAAAGNHLVSTMTGRVPFEYGLDLILDALERRLESPREG